MRNHMGRRDQSEDSRESLGEDAQTTIGCEEQGRGTRPTAPWYLTRKLLYVLALPLALFGSSPAQASASETCSRVSLDQSLPWISSAVYVAHRGEIVVNSPLAPDNKSMFAFSQNGRLLWSREGDSVPSSIVPVPSALSTEGLRYVEMSSRGEVQWLDDRFQPTSEKASFAQIDATAELVVDSFFQRIITGSGWVVGYGAVKDRSAQVPLYGFIAQNLVPRNNGRQAVELLFPLTANELFYRLGNPLVTAIGDDVYFLALESSPQLYRVDLASDSLPELLPGLPGERSLVTPDLQERALGYSPDLIYGKLESFHGFPHSIYSYAGRLLVLYQPEKPGAGWRLVTLRPKGSSVSVEGSIVIPTTAPHLTLAPAPEHFVVFEKSRVVDERQSVSTILSIPTRWIVSPDRREPRVMECR